MKKDDYEMKKKNLTWVILLGAALFSSPLRGQFVKNVSKVGTTGAAFLEIGVGARAVAVGGAFVAVADDATALYWNPAGICKLGANEVTLNHTAWLAETNFDYAGVVIPLGSFGTIGVNATSLSMADMEVRTVFYPEGTGERFSAGDFSMGISYGRSLTDRFSIGFTMKYITQRIWHMTASSVAFDIGTLFTTRFKDMKIGMSISNFGPKMQLHGKDTLVKHDVDLVKYGNNSKILADLRTDSWSLPLIFRVGLAMDLLKGQRDRLTLATDAVYPNNNTESMNFGAEYGFNDFIFLRLGFNSLFERDRQEGLTAGGGLIYDLTRDIGLKVDYAFADYGLLNSAHRFSLGIRF